MRGIWVVCAALVLLAGFGAGCGHQPAPDQGEIKQAFIRQLIGFCADVDRQLANVSMERQPGIYADQFGAICRPGPEPTGAGRRSRAVRDPADRDGRQRPTFPRGSDGTGGRRPVCLPGGAGAGAATVRQRRRGRPEVRHAATQDPPRPRVDDGTTCAQPVDPSSGCGVAAAACVFDGSPAGECGGGRADLGGGWVDHVDQATAATQIYDPLTASSTYRIQTADVTTNHIQTKRSPGRDRTSAPAPGWGT